MLMQAGRYYHRSLAVPASQHGDQSAARLMMHLPHELTRACAEGDGLLSLCTASRRPRSTYDGKKCEPRGSARRSTRNRDGDG